MGVPQGSILSVTLFILKISSIADAIPSSFEKSLFVDNFSISFSSTNMASIERQLQLPMFIQIFYQIEFLEFI